MSNVGYATLTVIPSAKGFAAALGGEVNPQMSAAGRSGGAALGGGVVGALSKFAGPIAGALSLGAVTSFVKGAISAASDLQQSSGAVEAVFKGQSAQVQKWAAESATAVGLTTNQYNEFASVLGSQLKNGGTAIDELGPKTNNLIKIGADLSSMFGGTTAEAVEALSATLRGETDPIERYGVSVNQAAVDAQAAAMGFKKVGGTYETNAKQAATLALIMKQTGDAQGNFARESDTLAHAQQVLSAQFENGKAAIGQAFLPAATALTNLLGSALGPAMQGTATLAQSASDGLAQFFGGFSSGNAQVGQTTSFMSTLGSAVRSYLQPLIDVWPQVSAAFAPFASVIGSTLSSILPQLASIAPNVSPISLVFRALAPVLPQIATLFGELAQTIVGNLGVALATIGPLVGQVATTLISLLSGVFVALMPTVSSLIQTFSTLIGQVTPTISALAIALMPVAQSILSALIPALTTIVTSVLPPFIAAFQQVLAAVLPVATQLIAALVPAFQQIVAVIAPVITILANALIPIINALMPVVTTVFTAIAAIITAAMQIVQGIINVVLGVITGNWSQVWQGIQQILSGVWNGIKAIVSGAFNVVRSVISAGLSIIRTLWNTAWSALGSLLSAAWGRITSAVSSGISSVVGFVSALPGKIVSGLGNVGSMLYSAGADLIRGFLNGIKSLAGNILSAVTGPISNAISGAKKLLGIHSPSRVFREIGSFTGQGMALGLQDSAGLVTKAANNALIPDVDPTVKAPTVKGGGLAGAVASAAGSGSSPYIGSVTLQSNGSVKSDLDELDFYVRTKTRGGRFA